MSDSPAPAKPAATPPRRVPIVVADDSRRATLIAIGSAVVVLAFIIGGFYYLSKTKTQAVGNKLTGVIVEKYATGETEKEVSVGKKGLRSVETETGFYFKVKVASEKDRIFDLSVNEGLYQARKVGDKQEFIRPPSEQK